MIRGGGERFMSPSVRHFRDKLAGVVERFFKA
jgi:hypothetical protein